MSQQQSAVGQKSQQQQWEDYWKAMQEYQKKYGSQIAQYQQQYQQYQVALQQRQHGSSGQQQQSSSSNQQQMPHQPPQQPNNKMPSQPNHPPHNQQQMQQQLAQVQNMQQMQQQMVAQQQKLKDQLSSSPQPNVQQNVQKINVQEQIQSMIQQGQQLMMQGQQMMMQLGMESDNMGNNSRQMDHSQSSGNSFNQNFNSGPPQPSNTGPPPKGFQGVGNRDGGFNSDARQRFGPQDIGGPGRQNMGCPGPKNMGGPGPQNMGGPGPQNMGGPGLQNMGGPGPQTMGGPGLQNMGSRGPRDMSGPGPRGPMPNNTNFSNPPPRMMGPGPRDVRNSAPPFMGPQQFGPRGGGQFGGMNRPGFGHHGPRGPPNCGPAGPLHFGADDPMSEELQDLDFNDEQWAAPRSPRGWGFGRGPQQRGPPEPVCPPGVGPTPMPGISSRMSGGPPAKPPFKMGGYRRFDDDDVPIHVKKERKRQKRLRYARNKAARINQGPGQEGGRSNKPPPQETRRCFRIKMRKLVKLFRRAIFEKKSAQNLNLTLSGDPEQSEQTSTTNEEVKSKNLDEEVKAENPNEPKSEDPDEAKNENPDEAKSNNPDEVKSKNPDEMKSENPDDVKSENPDDVKSENPHDVKSENGETRMDVSSPKPDEPVVRDLTTGEMRKPEEGDVDLMETSVDGDESDSDHSGSDEEREVSLLEAIPFENPFSNEELVPILENLLEGCRVDVECSIKENLSVPDHPGPVRCTLYIRNRRYGDGYGTSQDEAKNAAYCDLMSKLFKRTIEDSRNPGSDTQMLLKDIEKVEDPSIEKHKMEEEAEVPEEPVDDGMPRKPWSEFVILEHLLRRTDENPACILRQSAEFSKLNLDYTFENATPKNPKARPKIRCNITLERRILATAVDTNKASAKNEASDIALNKLIRDNYTIKIRPCLLGKLAYLYEPKRSKEKMAEAPIANPILEKLEWTGHALSRDGANLVMPLPLVMVSDLYEESQLELGEERKVSEEASQKLESIIGAYIASTVMDDLIFAPEFNKEERSQIRNLCRKLSLKCNQKKIEEDCFMFITKKTVGNELVKLLQMVDGKCNKYELFPPKNKI